MVADFVDHHARILPGRQWDPDSETGLWTCWVGLLYRSSFIVHRWPLRTICPGSGLLLPERDDRATRLRRSWSSHTGPVSTGRAFRGLPGAEPLRHRNGSVGAAFLPCGGLFSASLRRSLHASLRIPYAFRYFSTRSLSFSVTSGSRVRSMLFRRSAFFTAMA